MIEDRRVDKNIRAVDMLRLIETATLFKKSHKGDVVKIAVYVKPNNDKIISGTPTVNVVNAMFGFDWNQGSLILHPEVPVCKYDSSAEKKLLEIREMLALKCDPDDIIAYIDNHQS